MAHDKKRRGGALQLILTRGIGRAFADGSVAPDELEAFLERELDSAGLAVG
jgi:3-dehydroquinate synthetase